MTRLPQAILLWVLKTYKWMFSPLLPPSCRYVPSCSEYAMEAVERYGVLRGGLKATWRVLRCHPFVKGGLDPVVRENRFAAEASLHAHNTPMRLVNGK
jgi:putative membrane protein insertion efficiency factor